MRQVPRGDAAAVVLHRQANAGQPGKPALEVGQLLRGRVGGEAENEDAAIGHGVGRIEGQVQYGLAELDDVHIDGQLAGGQFGLDANAARQDFADQLDQFGHRLVEIVILAGAGLATMQADDALDELAGLERTLLDEVQRGQLFVFGAGLGEDQFCQGQDSRHKIAEIVSQPHCQQRECFLPGGG